MRFHHPLFSIMSLVAMGATACGGLSTEKVNNGERGEVSLAIGGVPAEHQPFEVIFYVQRPSAICGEGERCLEDVPIVGMAAGCDDESICSVQQQEPTEEGARCRVVVDAHQAGTARLLVEVELLTGEIRRDSFLINVARPDEMQVTCDRCDSGLAPGEQAEATCSLFNRSISDLPLLGSCDAWAMDEAVEIIGATTVAPSADATETRGPRIAGQQVSRTGRAFGNVFTVRKRLPSSGELVFSGGEVQRRVTAR